MSDAHSDVFRASLNRCLRTPDFLHDFYEMFMGSDQAIREKFRNTDFPRQTRMLADSLYLMAVAAASKDHAVAWKELDRLAQGHARTGLDINPRHYDTWLESLIRAAGRYDPEFTPETEEAWRRSLAPGIERLRSRY